MYNLWVTKMNFPNGTIGTMALYSIMKPVLR